MEPPTVEPETLGSAAPGASSDLRAVIFQTISNHTAISHSTAILTLGKITEQGCEALIVVHLMT